jgi:CRP-like cAMP-binding protein
VAEREPEDVVLAEGEVLFRQGDPGDLVYVVKSGAVETYRELSDGGEESLDVLKEDRYFGELAPTLRMPRSASVRAIGGPAVVTAYTLRRFRRDHPSSSLGQASH